VAECGEILNRLGGGYMNDFFAREFWRFVMVQQYFAKLAETAKSADAGPGVLQPRCGEEEGRRDDQEPPGSVRKCRPER
jgi:hypothetical protein